MKNAAFFGVLAAALAVAATGAGRASAGLLGCGNQAYSQTFASWNDGSSYALAPGGSFEGTNSWSLSGGARVVSGNEPFYLTSKSDSRSLLLPPGSSAMSPAVCLQTLSPAVRLVGKSSDGSAVRVTAYSKTLLGLVQLPLSATIDLSTGWDASEKQQILLQNVLALTNLGTANVYFRFAPVGSATVQLDDFYVDPLLQC